MGGLIPKIVSAQAHRRFDILVFPCLLGATVWMARRNGPAASLVALTTATEAASFLTTDYPPAVLPWMGFRDHIRVGLIVPTAIAALAFLFRDIPPRERRFVLALLVLPIVSNVLSDGDQE